MGNPIDIEGPLDGLSQNMSPRHIPNTAFVTAENVVNVAGVIRPRPGRSLAFAGEFSVGGECFFDPASPGAAFELALDESITPNKLYYIFQAEIGGNYSIRSVDVDGTDDAELVSTTGFTGAVTTDNLRGLHFNSGVVGTYIYTIDAVNNYVYITKTNGDVHRLLALTGMTTYSVTNAEIQHNPPLNTHSYVVVGADIGGSSTLVLSQMFSGSYIHAYTETGTGKYKNLSWNTEDQCLYAVNSLTTGPDGASIVRFTPKVVIATGEVIGFDKQETFTAPYDVSDMFYHEGLRRLYFTTDEGTLGTQNVYFCPVNQDGELGSAFQIATTTDALDHPRGIAVDSSGNVYWSTVRE